MPVQAARVTHQNNLYGKKRGSINIIANADLVNGIPYSSGLGGCTMSCLSVLDSEHHGLSGDGLEDILDLIIWPAQPREYE